MKVFIFTVLLVLCTAFVRAGGQAYEVTNYGGKHDHYREENPSCLDSQWPDTDYYAAVSTTYKKELCEKYAVIMGVNLDNPKIGNMVRVKIVDSCGECERSHIDISKLAFGKIGDVDDGRFKVIWVAADDKGEVFRDVVYPSDDTRRFAEKKFGLSKDKFVSMFKKQALRMIKDHHTEGYFDKYDVPKTTTTTRKTTTTAVKTATGSAPTPAVTENIPNVGDINISFSEEAGNAIPDNAPIVGQSKVLDPNKTDYTEEELKFLEDNLAKELEEHDKGKPQSYTAGILSAASFSVAGAAGIGLLYLKKKSPGRYDELKQKFPEAFSNIKRSVSRSATSIRRGATSIRRGVTRTASSIRGKNNRTEITRHGSHSDFNYREMPEYMYGEDGLPRYQLHDEPMMRDFPEANIKI